MTDRQRHGFILLLVAGLIAASVVVLLSMKTFLGLDLKGGVELVYQGEPTAQSGVTPAALNRAVDVMRNRVDQLGVSEPEIQTYGGNQISVGLPNVHDTARAIQEVGTTARLEFYDWEANLLLPTGKTVASLGPAITGDQQATTLSQGSGVAPGSPGAGSMSLYDAVKLASKQPVKVSSDNARKGPQYYMFGAPGSSACSTAGKALGYTPATGQHCLISGPDNGPGALTSLKSAATQIGIDPSKQQILTVPQGTVILQATPASFAHPPNPNNPSTQFYVLKDHVALFGNDITNPQQSTDQSGAPDVSFGFTSHGKNAFQNVTAAISKRGQLISGVGQQLNQHFAVALDQLLITVPQIDYRQNPDGIPGDTGAQITGGFTSTSAGDLANELRLGALPINLKRISVSEVSASLGKQALHDGLIAGAAGLAAVILFLLFYYRMLGVIATAGLVTYALYFYALIKLIPVTLTLSGIAGLILTIGVAADANIVIFERVKEEIRAGRSVRQGIATGYRKGLTAIIDANVVTILTAFILFVVATADVKGFALTLGIGTFVSLFTAVMATQAVLMTMGSSRAISRPSLLGAEGPKRQWRFDFMGASKFFFSMSGVILLVGALAVGGRGLNLGIDFTGGTRITASLQHPASQSQVSSAITAAGVSAPTVQKVTNAKLGPTVYQIQSKTLGPSKVPQVRSNLQNRFGLRSFDETSVGSTFGHTIENAAVIAIIASLLVISIYVALRFEWKFAVPVLIALMHDLLITSGVYALTGRQVTVDTVAALLTILGYSLYDTIIVFDRVRENIPRMPRAAFSQIVNRSMSEVLTRSLATTSCTLMPIVALLLFGGGGVLGDFAFALLIGVASGAYSSIFIASPVLTHWKEREQVYRARRRRLIEDNGFVPAYAAAGADVEPPKPKRAGRTGRLTQPDPDKVSSAEFEQMKRDLEVEREPAGRRTSTLTKRLARSEEPEVAPAAKPKPTDGTDGAGEVERAPDIPENEGVAPVEKPKAPKSRSRSRRRHGRRR
jgi:SecD/SecF fusion protein